MTEQDRMAEEFPRIMISVMGGLLSASLWIWFGWFGLIMITVIWLLVAVVVGIVEPRGRHSR